MEFGYAPVCTIWAHFLVVVHGPCYIYVWCVCVIFFNYY